MIEPANRELGELLRLDGRGAVVTGGARGIGLAIARRLSELGAQVVIADVDPSVSVVAAGQRASGHHMVDTVMDVTDPQDHERVAREVETACGRLDIWVNNAGYFPTDLALDMSPTQWRRVIEVNLDGAFFGSVAAAKRMTENGGVILNLASTSAFRVSTEGLAHYVSSKSGVRGLTQALAREWGPRGIRVLGIAPTLTKTEGVLEGATALAAARGAADVFDDYAAQLPMRRVATPDDVARVAAFCVSDMASFMTGSVLAVDGGHLA